MGPPRPAKARCILSAHRSHPDLHTHGYFTILKETRAKVYLSRAGILEFLLDKPNHPPMHTYFTESSWAFLRKLRIEDRLVLTDLPVEVAAGLSFETTGGHHPGSAAVKVTTVGGLLGILETAFTRENIDNEQPIGVAENAAVCRSVIRRYKRECDLVLAVHDNTLLQRFPRGLITCSTELG